MYYFSYFAIITLLGVTFTTAPAIAETVRYVATTGSDTTGDGTEANPWVSITHATLNCTDGDLILVKPGTYYGPQALHGQ